MILSGEELKEREIKALEELNKKEIYIKLQDAHDFAGTVCDWDCIVCRCNDKAECKMAVFLEKLPKYQPTMERVRGEE